MANIRIKDLPTTAATLAVDDFIELDGAVNGSRKFDLNTFVATSADKLETARSIGGTAFDGTANVSAFPSPGPIGTGTPNTAIFTKVGINTAPGVNSDMTILRSVPAVTAEASFEIKGPLTAAYDLHPNAFRDSTIFTGTVAADAYASYDAAAVIAGTIAYNHFSGFQARHNYGGSGILDNMAGFNAQLVVSAGTVTAIKMFHGVQPNIAGTVTDVYGLYIDDLGSAGTNRHAIWTNGDDAWFNAGGSIFTSQDLTLPAGALNARMGCTFSESGQTGLAVMQREATYTGKLITFHRDGGGEMAAITQVNATTVAYNTTSDRRLKENIRLLTDVGDLIDAFEPVVHDWKRGSKNAHGFIAQDLHKVYPAAVSVGDDGDEVTNPWGIDYSKLVPVLTAEVKNLRARVKTLEAA